MLKPPCACHPETGRACEHADKPKGEEVCVKCDWRVRYAVAVERGLSRYATEEEISEGPSGRLACGPGEGRPVKGSDRCYWAGCRRRASLRGLCRSHYELFRRGRFALFLGHAPLDGREQLYRTVMEIAERYDRTVNDVLAILIDEGALQYRRRVGREK